MKYLADRTVERYKVRMVAKDYNQREGLYYNEIFSPLVKIVTLRAIIAIVAAEGWPIHQMDVYNAFLQGDLLDEVYMQLHKGFTSQGEPRCCM